MQIYTLLEDPKIMGEEHPTYGFTMWCNHVEEVDIPIMFNSHSGNVLAGAKLVAESQTMKTSAKGINYWRLSKVKVNEPGGLGEHGSLRGGGELAPTSSSPNTIKEPKAAAYLKDASTVPLDVYRVRANINGLPANDTERQLFFENVMADSNELLRLIGNVRAGAESPFDE